MKLGRVVVDGCDVDEGFDVHWEFPDSLGLQHVDPERRPDLVAAGFTEDREYRDHRYRQTYDKSDPRLGGFRGYTEHAGYRLRVIDRANGQAHVVMSRFGADLVGFAGAEHAAAGWVRDTGEPPPRPPIDEALIPTFRPHTAVRFAPADRMIHILRERADSMSLYETTEEGPIDALTSAGFSCDSSESAWDREIGTTTYRHSLEISKLDRRLDVRWVRYRTMLVRMIDERDGHVLVVAETSLGRSLDFAAVRCPDGTGGLACRWIPVGDVETVAV